MSLKWHDYPGAPAPGSMICDVKAIPETGILSTRIGGFPVLVLHNANRTHVFVNACPHQFLPLDQRSNSILSSDGLRLMCSNHSAEFDIETGKGTKGFGTGCQLVEVPSSVTTDRLYIRK